MTTLTPGKYRLILLRLKSCIIVLLPYYSCCYLITRAATLLLSLPPYYYGIAMTRHYRPLCANGRHYYGIAMSYLLSPANGATGVSHVPGDSVRLLLSCTSRHQLHKQACRGKQHPGAVLRA
jgi:hypothetical protein